MANQRTFDAEELRKEAYRQIELARDDERRSTCFNEPMFSGKAFHLGLAAQRRDLAAMLTYAAQLKEQDIWLLDENAQLRREITTMRTHNVNRS